MSLAQVLTLEKFDQNLVRTWANDIAFKIRSVSNPNRIILFGSAAEGLFKVGSDIDLLLVYADEVALKAGRSAVRKLGRLNSEVALDLIFVSQDLFDSKKKYWWCLLRGSP